MLTNIFFGVKIIGDLAKSIKEWQLANPHVDVSDIVWIPEEKLHITLVPPWYIEERDIESVKQKIEKGILYYPVTEFVVDFPRITFGPDEKSPKFIMAKGNYTSSINPVRKIAEVCLCNQGVSTKPIFPYIPIASFLGPVSISILEYVTWSYHVKNFSLMKSIDPDDSESFEILENYKMMEF
jgi:2'-5' RNA ligase